MTSAAGLGGHFAGEPTRAAQPLNRPAAAWWVKQGLALGRSASWAGLCRRLWGSPTRRQQLPPGVAVREVAGQHLQLRNLVTGVVSNLGEVVD